MRLKEWELGTELSILDRARLDLGYYHRVAEDQILSQDISTTSGFGSRQVNVGETMNKGVEALLDASLVRSEGFNWNTTFNINWNKSKVSVDWYVPTGCGTLRHAPRVLYQVEAGDEPAYGYA
jgi:outer membrane receptor protein involved in Fe transport